MRQVLHLMRLARAGLIVARYDGIVGPAELAEMPWQARLGLRLAKPFAGKPRAGVANALAAALTDLGPSYIKLGQFLATRPDVVGADRAVELSDLQDRMPPFAQAEAEAEVARALGAPVDQLFTSFSQPIAAASIAQVHKATVRDDDGAERTVAVKVLRPGIEERFARDLDSFYFAASLADRYHAPSRRLRPVDTVDTLARSVKLEMDLRLEAAAMSEMAENVAEDPGFRVPGVDWTRTARRVLTTEWIDGIALSDLAALKASGHDLAALGDTVIQSFLRHAIRDGFFHADMHQGNLFVDRDGLLVAVDFGIMGRLGLKERRFLAEILYGFITRDYARVSQVHFEAGYVPDHQDPAVFAQALRSIGEPMMDKTADQISMARLLTQLFQVTEQFDMKTQPQLLLLQKTMVVVEGVARVLNPKLNMWQVSEPVVRQWIEQKLGPQGRLEDAADGAVALGRVVGAFPEMLVEAQRAAHMVAEMTSAGGIRLDSRTTSELAREQSRQGRSTRVAIWLGALALVAMAIGQFWH